MAGKGRKGDVGAADEKKPGARSMRKEDLLRELTAEHGQQINPSWTVPELRAMVNKIRQTEAGPKVTKAKLNTMKLYELQALAD